MDGLPSSASSGSDDVEAPCPSAESASGSGDEEEGHPPHLYDMSSLKAQLPLPPPRRGLSRFYGGKSQSFRSLGSVKAVEDLPEPEPEPGRRSRGNGCKKQMIAANLHGCSSLSKVISKATRMDVRPPSIPRDHQTVLASDSAFFRVEAESHLRMK